MNYDWPGDVRELENLVEKALIRATAGAPGDELIFEYFPPPRLATRAITQPEEPLKLDDLVRNHITEVLSLCRGKVEGPGGAAEKLGINPSTLRNRMLKLGVVFGKGGRNKVRRA